MENDRYVFIKISVHIMLTNKSISRLMSIKIFHKLICIFKYVLVRNLLMDSPAIHVHTTT